MSATLIDILSEESHASPVALTCVQFDAMKRLGILPSDERIELIDGLLLYNDSRDTDEAGVPIGELGRPELRTGLIEAMGAHDGVHVVPLTNAQYLAMISAGILEEGAPIELIDGLLVYKDRRDDEGDIMTVGPRHAHIVKILIRALNRLLSDRNCHIQSQQPVAMTVVNNPEPDIAVIRGDEDDYPDRHSAAEDVLLVIEVAKRSLAFDRGRKAELYATAGIPQYVIVDIEENLVELREDPDRAGGANRSVKMVRRGESLELNVPGRAVSIAVDDVLGTTK